MYALHVSAYEKKARKTERSSTLTVEIKELRSEQENIRSSVNSDFKQLEALVKNETDDRQEALDNLTMEIKEALKQTTDETDGTDEQHVDPNKRLDVNGETTDETDGTDEQHVDPNKRRETNLFEKTDETDGNDEQQKNDEPNKLEVDIQEEVLLKEALHKVNLHAEYWSKTLLTELKIRNLTQLQHLGCVDINKIKRCGEEWEINALLKVVKTHGGMTDMSSGQPDYDIVTKASGGSILQGVLWTKDRKDFLTPRQSLVSVPNDITLLNPTGATKIFDIGSESRHTLEALERYANSSAIKLAVEGSLDGPGGSLADTGVQWSKTKAEAKFRADNREELAFSYTKYKFIPMRSFQLKPSPSTLTISQDAMSALRKIEQCKGKSKQANECQRFFEHYGSHVNMGMFQLGGIFSWTITICKESHLSESEIKSRVDKAFDAYMKSGAEGCNASLEGLRIKQRNNTSGSRIGNEQTETKFSTHVDGGLTTASTLQEWEDTLKNDCSKWQVIDCGKLEDKDFKPIWELIEDRRELFKKPNRLGKALREQFNREIEKHIKICKSNIDDVIANHESSNDGSTYYKDLQKLDSQVRSLKIFTKGVEKWENVLRKKAEIPRFLLKAKKEVQTGDEQLVAKIIQEMVKNVYFSARDSILQMISDQSNGKCASKIIIIIKNNTSKELEYKPKETKIARKCKWVDPKPPRAITAGDERRLTLTTSKDVDDCPWSIEAEMVYKMAESLYIHIQVANTDQGPPRISLNIQSEKKRQPLTFSRKSIDSIDITEKGYNVRASLKRESLQYNRLYAPLAEVSINPAQPKLTK